MLIAAKNKAHIWKIKAQLKKEFDMQDLGKTKKILGKKQKICLLKKSLYGLKQTLR